MKTSFIKLLFLISGLFISHFLLGQTPDAGTLFDQEDIIDITLETDLKLLFRDVGDEREYHPAKMRYKTGEIGDSVEVELRTRGNFRRQRSVCNLPPIRIKFNKENAAGTLFEKQKKLKLVTVCQFKKDSYEQNLLLEYLSYKSYNILTDSSFRVRLARITYVDLAGKVDTFVRYSFFIEDEKKMAERIESKIMEIKNVHPLQTARHATARMSVFQYMIGNTDWSISALHNVRLVGINGKGDPITVPYDFDWCGAISAPYAKPNPILGLPNVETRLYRGFCRSEEEFARVFKEFMVAKEEIYALYQNCEMLNEKYRKRVLAYYDDFYRTISDEKRTKKEIFDYCRTSK